MKKTNKLTPKEKREEDLWILFRYHNEKGVVDIVYQRLLQKRRRI